MTTTVLLLAHGAGVDARTKYIWFDEHHPTPDTVNQEGRTPLLLAAGRGYVDLAKVLLAAGANVNASALSGKTPLHCAAEGGYSDLLRVLVAAGADANAKTIDGGTPLRSAVAWGRAEAIPLLLAAGAKVNERNNDGKTALDVTKTDECRTLLRQAGGKTGAELDAEKPAPPDPSPAPQTDPPAPAPAPPTVEPGT